MSITAQMLSFTLLPLGNCSVLLSRVKSDGAVEHKRIDNHTKCSSSISLIVWRPYLPFTQKLLCYPTI